MPGMSGFDVCARLRARFPPSQLPIIMVSAKSEEEDVRMVRRTRRARPSSSLMRAVYGLYCLAKHQSDAGAKQVSCLRSAR